MVQARNSVHEGVPTRFLKRAWPRLDGILDLRQEAYVRTCEAALQSCPLHPKAFLISIARHVLVDRRRERIVSIQVVGITADWMRTPPISTSTTTTAAWCKRELICC